VKVFIYILGVEGCGRFSVLKMGEVRERACACLCRILRKCGRIVSLTRCVRRLIFAKVCSYSSNKFCFFFFFPSLVIWEFANSQAL
jgi:hypothetical protein